MNTTALKPVMVKAAIKLKKHAPTILVGAGLASMVGAGVLACRATLKAEAVMDEHKKNLKLVKDTREEMDETVYSEKDYQKDLTIVYARTCMAYAKLYGPAVTLAIGGATAILAGYNIINKRSVAIMAAYNALEKTYKEYRARVQNTMSEDEDRYFKTGIFKDKIEQEVVDEKGKKKKEKTEVLVADDEDITTKLSPYSRIYDDGCTGWTKDPENNLIVLRNTQSYFNDLLKINGFVLLNDVYEALGFPRTQAGAVVGWALGNGDNYIDFGIYDVHNRAARDFVNGYERNIILDFNVDGIIIDKI